MMMLILALITLFCAYGIKQTKQQGNVFGLVVSLIATLTFAFSTVLSVII